MAQISYVDWDGLVYYDGKIKKYISDKLEECVKFGGEVPFSKLPDPSYQTLNYVFKITDSFISTSDFKLSGYTYSAGTIVQVVDYDGVYLYTILNESSTGDGGGGNSSAEIEDLEDRVSDIETSIGEFATKEFVSSEISKITVPDDYITETDLEAKGYLTAVPDTYALKSDIPTVPTKISDLENDSDFLTAIPEEYVTDSELDAKGYITEHQDISGKSDVGHKHSMSDITDYTAPDLSSYALKSEIPDVSDFLTSVPEEYITEDELNSKGYLTEHQSLDGYAKLEDIPTDYIKQIPDEYVTETELANKGYITDISDKADKSELDSLGTRVNDLSNTVDGKADSAHTHSLSEITDYQEPDLSSYALKSELPTVPTKTSELTNDSNFATTAEVEEVRVSIPNIGGLATQDSVDSLSDRVDELSTNKADKTSLDSKLDVETYNADKGAFLTEDSLAGYAKTTDIESTYATQTFVQQKIAEAELSGSEVDLSAFYTKDETYNRDEIDAKIPDVSNFITSIPEEYVTDDELASKGYLTEHQSLAEYAKKTDIPDVSNFISEIPSEYVTEEELNAKGFITEHQDLSDYAKKADIPDVSKFITEIPSEYVTETELSEKGYITEHQSLEGYATEDYVNDAIANAKIDGEQVDLSDYAKKTDIPDVSKFITEIPEEYVTDTELSQKGYLTEHQDISGKADVEHTHSISEVIDYVAPDLSSYALKSEIPDVSNFITSVPDEYITETELNAKGYLTQHQSLEGYAKIEDIPTDYLTQIPAEYVTDTELESKGYITDVSDKADIQHTHTLKDIDDYQAPDLSGYALKSDLPTVPTKTSELTNDSNFATKDEIPDVSEFITEIPSEYITETELDAKGYLTQHQSLDGYAKVEDIPDVSAYITMSDVESKNYLTAVPSEYITESELDAKGYLTEHQDLSGKADTDHSHTLSDITDYSAPDLTPYAKASDVETALTSKANDILFTEDYVVNTPIGGFVAGESVKGMALKDILIKLLGLVSQTTQPSVVETVMSNKYPTYILDESGALVPIAYEYIELTKETAKANSSNTYFYQIVDENGEVIESGYQIATIEQENDWLTISIPSVITNYHVEVYDATAGDWTTPTWKFIESGSQTIDGYTTYVVAEQYEITSGITVRVVIDE